MLLGHLRQALHWWAVVLWGTLHVALKGWVPDAKHGSIKSQDVSRGLLVFLGCACGRRFWTREGYATPAEEVFEEIRRKLS